MSAAARKRRKAARAKSGPSKGRIAGLVAGGLVVAQVAGVLSFGGGDSVAGADPLPLEPIYEVDPAAGDDGHRHVVVTVDPDLFVAEAHATDDSDEPAEESATTTTEAASRTTITATTPAAPAVSFDDVDLEELLGPEAAFWAKLINPDTVDVAKLVEVADRLARFAFDDDNGLVAVLNDGTEVSLAKAQGSTERVLDGAPPASGRHVGPRTVTAGDPPPAEVGDAVNVVVPDAVRVLAADPAVHRLVPVDHVRWAVTTDLTDEELTEFAGVVSVADDAIMLPASDDTYWSSLWGLENPGGTFGGIAGVADADVDAETGWEVADGSGVVVAVIDTGIDPDHPDLADKLWTNPNERCGNGIDDDLNGYVDDCDGWDFYNDDNTPFDPAVENRHGTHVAGTIAAVPDNGIGIAGLAPGVTIMSLKAFQPTMRMSDGARAVRYAVDNGASVINASWGTSPGAPRETVAALEAAISYAREHGVLFVAAAGNSANNNDVLPVWPASFPHDNIIAVAASTAADRAASFSNLGRVSVDVFAPGHYIVSTVPGGYAAMQGTSMAAPHVAAAAALLRSEHPELSPAQVAHQIMVSSDTNLALARKVWSGGRLNVAEMLGLEGGVSPSMAAEYHGFVGHVSDELIDGRIRIWLNDADGVAAERFVYRATLFTIVKGEVHGVVDHAVHTVGGVRRTDTHAQVLLGAEPTSVDDDAGLVAEGVDLRFATALPTGTYALYTEVVDARNPERPLTPPSAVFFAVAAGEGEPVDPTPAPAPSPDITQPPASPTPSPTPAPQPGADPPSSPQQPSAGNPGGGSPGGGDPIDTADPTGPGTPVQPGDPTEPGAPGPGGPSQPVSTAPTDQSPSDPTSPGGGGGGGGSTTPVSPSPSDPGSPTPSDPAPSPTNPGTSDPGTPSTPGTPVTEDGMTLNSVRPASGSTTGYDLVTVLGRNLPQFGTVSFGGRTGVVLTRTDTAIDVLTPMHAAGNVDVTVADFSGRSVTLPGAYTYVAPAGECAPGSVSPATIETDMFSSFGDRTNENVLGRDRDRDRVEDSEDDHDEGQGNDDKATKDKQSRPWDRLREIWDDLTDGDDTPADETPTDETPTDETPVDDAPAGETPVGTSPVVDESTGDGSTTCSPAVEPPSDDPRDDQPVDDDIDEPTAGGQPAPRITRPQLDGWHIRDNGLWTGVVVANNPLSGYDVSTWFPRQCTTDPCAGFSVPMI